MNNTVPTTRDQCKGTAQIDNAPIQNRALRRRPVAGSEEITYGPDDQQPYGSAPTTANIAVPRRKVPQPLDAINFPDAHLRLEVVLALVGMSRSQWYRLIESGHAPNHCGSAHVARDGFRVRLQNFSMTELLRERRNDAISRRQAGQRRSAGEIII